MEGEEERTASRQSDDLGSIFQYKVGPYPTVKQRGTAKLINIIFNIAEKT